MIKFHKQTALFIFSILSICVIFVHLWVLNHFQLGNVLPKNNFGNTIETRIIYENKNVTNTNANANININNTDIQAENKNKVKPKLKSFAKKTINIQHTSSDIKNVQNITTTTTHNNEDTATTLTDEASNINTDIDVNTNQNQVVNGINLETLEKKIQADKRNNENTIPIPIAIASTTIVNDIITKNENTISEEEGKHAQQRQKQYEKSIITQDPNIHNKNNAKENAKHKSKNLDLNINTNENDDDANTNDSNKNSDKIKNAENKDNNKNLDFPPSQTLSYAINYNGFTQQGNVNWKFNEGNYSVDMGKTINLGITKISLLLQSKGTVTNHGLQPTLYKRTQPNKEYRTEFNWEDKTVFFSRTNETQKLTSNNTKDFASILFQLIAILRAGDNNADKIQDVYPFEIATDKIIETWRIAYKGEKSLIIDDEMVKTHHFVRLPRDVEDKRKIEWWLEPSQGWMMAKFKQTEPDGDVLEFTRAAKAKITNAKDKDMH
jgi:Protein of unknown function (DUF3108)